MLLKKILTHGLLAGVIVGVPLFVITVLADKQAPPPSWGIVVGYLIMLIALSVVFVAVKRHRDNELGGVIRFWPAFGLGLGISVVAGIVYVLAWEAALAVTKWDFAGGYAELLIEQEKAKGVSAEALAKFSAEMQQFRADYAKPLYRLTITFSEIFPVGLLVSLVSAALLRNPRFWPARRG